MKFRNKGDKAAVSCLPVLSQKHFVLTRTRSIIPVSNVTLLQWRQLWVVKNRWVKARMLVIDFSVLELDVSFYRIYGLLRQLWRPRIKYIERYEVQCKFNNAHTDYISLILLINRRTRVNMRLFVPNWMESHRTQRRYILMRRNR